ncbi:MAG TPA: cytochrome c, partial [Pirellulales bacterium]|nr:cytochrome c [Pirellulales bacterium]
MNKITLRGLRRWPLLAGLLLLAGCGKYEPPPFHSNMVEMDRQGVAAGQEQDIANILDALFGTPDAPFVLAETGLDLKKLEQAAGPVRSDQFGKESGLYRRHCGHCHGTTGDGLGPTALILNPYPRDYRQGKFKFKSTDRPDKPTTADLEMILRHGIPGTAMPSFDLLPDSQLQVLIEYVKYLSMRGETEIRLISAMTELSEGTLEISRAAIVDEILKPVVENWTVA